MSLGLSPIFLQILDAQALGWGLVLGDDEDFSRFLKQTTRDAGVTHLTAASGANIRLFQRVLQPFKWSFWLLLILEIGMVFLYWNLSGASGSLWRASVFSLLLSGGKIFGRPVSVFWLLLFVVLATLGTDWLDNLGFWLSWLAITGVFVSQRFLSGENKTVFSPHLYNFVKSVRSDLYCGAVVLTFVSGIILQVFGVWQPQGFLGTFLSTPLLPSYITLFLIVVSLEKSNLVAQDMSNLDASILSDLGSLLAKLLQIFFGCFFLIWAWVAGLPALVTNGLFGIVLIFILRELFSKILKYRAQRTEAAIWGWR